MENVIVDNRALAGVDALSKNLKGRVLVEGNEDYNAARKVWNGMVDRRPAAIAQCLDSDDVISAVKFARENALLVSVRGGGHNIAGNSVCEGGLMIDLSRMKAIHVYPSTKTATAEPGVLWQEFDAATQQHGLGTTGGTVS